MARDNQPPPAPNYYSRGGDFGRDTVDGNNVPFLIYPTPGGAAGDASIEGELDVQGGQSTLESLHIIRGGKNLEWTLFYDNTGNLVLSSPNAVAIAPNNATPSFDLSPYAFTVDFEPHTLGGGVTSVYDFYLNHQILAVNGINTSGQTGSVTPYASGSGLGETTAVTVSYTPPTKSGLYIAHGYIHVTTAGSGTASALEFEDSDGNLVNSGNYIPCLPLNGSGVVNNITATGYYTFSFVFAVDASATQAIVTITPNGSTFSYFVAISQVA